MGCINSNTATRNPNVKKQNTQKSRTAAADKYHHYAAGNSHHTEHLEMDSLHSGQHQKGASSPASYLQATFHQLLQFFDIEPHDKNAIINVYHFLDKLRDPHAALNLSLKFTKVLFEFYDRDHNGYLDQEELMKFYCDWKSLLGQRRNSIRSQEWKQLVELHSRNQKTTYEDFIKLGLIERDITQIQQLIREHHKKQQNDDIIDTQAAEEDELVWEDEETATQQDAAPDSQPNGIHAHPEGGTSKYDSTNSTPPPQVQEILNSVQTLKSDSITEQFLPILNFFHIKRSDNLLRDIIQLREALFDETAETYSTKKLQRQIVQRLLKFTFDFYDADHSGWMSREELIRFMEDVLEALPPEDEFISAEMMVEEFIRECDEDDNGKIEYHEIHRHLPLIYQKMMSQ